MADEAVAIIPARLAATRLPNKPLLDIAGKTMIQRVYEQVRKATLLSDVLVATPDTAILDAVAAFGGKAVLTSPDHRTGTDRIAEAAASLPVEVTIIVNVQGDEPLIDPATIDALTAVLLPHPHPDLRSPLPLSESERGKGGACDLASVMCPLPEGRENDPNVVKVVCDMLGNALYFSRAPIPYRRNPEATYAPMQHVGMYAYRRDLLMRFPTLPQTPLERLESLEQLRALENGHRIRMVQTTHVPESVDTPEDLERVRSLFRFQGA
jgi:3-deoxy-manno-octulosonate cytidylyltransferase (CMP-KDO synthetase)